MSNITSRLIRIGKRVQNYLLKAEYDNLKFKGKSSVICYNSEFYNSKDISINEYVYIGHRYSLYAREEIIIKDGAILADDIHIRTANHYYDNDNLKMV